MSEIQETIIVHMDGIHDDTAALQAALEGLEVRFPDGRIWNYEAHKGDTDE
jgi:hypothetical protein